MTPTNKCLECEAKKLISIANELIMNQSCHIPVEVVMEKLPEAMHDDMAQISLDKFLGLLLIYLRSLNKRLIALEKESTAEKAS